MPSHFYKVMVERNSLIGMITARRKLHGAFAPPAKPDPGAGADEGGRPT